MPKKSPPDHLRVVETAPPSKPRKSRAKVQTMPAPDLTLFVAEAPEDFTPSARSLFEKLHAQFESAGYALTVADAAELANAVRAHESAIAWRATEIEALGGCDMALAEKAARLAAAQERRFSSALGVLNLRGREMGKKRQAQAKAGTIGSSPDSKWAGL